MVHIKSSIHRFVYLSLSNKELKICVSLVGKGVSYLMNVPQIVGFFVE